MVELDVELLETMALLLFLPVVAVTEAALDKADFLSCVFLPPLSRFGLAPWLFLLEVASTTRLVPVR